MFKSLQMRMVFVLILLIVSVMLVVGTFILNSTTNFYNEDFTKQMNKVFTKEYVDTLTKQSENEDAQNVINRILGAYSAQLEITGYRDYYILDGKTAGFLQGSNLEAGAELVHTPNIITALSGKVGQEVKASASYMDYAVPIMSSDGKDVKLIVYVKDTKEQLKDVTWMIFAIIVQALFFGLIIAVIMSFLLARTITTPVENLTKGAQLIASGDFDYKIVVNSSDEIGTLTNTFNKMASVLKDTLNQIDSQKNTLETLFLYLADGVIAFDTNGNLLQINEVCKSVLNINDTDDVTFDSVFGKEEISVKTNDILTLDKNKNLIKNVEINDKYIKLIFARFETQNQGGGIIVVIHDVTEQFKLDISRREFIANVSHELRTPLTSIKSYTETVVDSPDLPRELIDKFLLVVINEADRMTRIVKDLLVISRLDNNKMDWKFTSFQFKTLLENMYDAMLMDAKKHEHNLKLSIDNDLGKMWGDKERLEQVIINIVSNAVKYTPDGGNIEILARRDNDLIRFSVKDNGIGIPKQDIPRLFERFYRVDKARSREKGGTGLGLAIAKEIIAAHGGKIEIESNINVGTVVKIVFPCNLKAPITETNL